MLDSNFNAKFGDFGPVGIVDHEKGSQTTALAGTMSYQTIKQSDIYSFGLVALEIACGRKPINPNAKEGEIIMLEWV